MVKRLCEVSMLYIKAIDDEPATFSQKNVTANATAAVNTSSMQERKPEAITQSVERSRT